MSELSLHFLRPWWLLALIPIALLFIRLWKRHTGASAWERVVDPKLQQYVIEPGAAKRAREPWFLLIVWLFVVLVLSGPVWEKQPVPVFKGQQAQVILFDLSSSMLSEDIKPSRLARARFKLKDLLKTAEGVQIALIAFTERPYVVSPISDDANTIAAFVDALDPQIMPVQGSRPDLALEKAIELLQQASVSAGQIILFTDAEVGAREINAATTVRNAGHQLSVIGVGTPTGTPLRGADGRFLQDASGNIVVPQLKQKALQGLASAGNGVYVQLQSDNSDLETLRKRQASLSIQTSADQKDQSQIYWIEYGPWFLLPIALCALMLFRRGVMW